jgi:hypothetical protein
MISARMVVFAAATAVAARASRACTHPSEGRVPDIDPRMSAHRLLPAAQDADEGDVGDAGEGVLKSPASGVLAGLLVGVVAWWSGW